VITAVPHGFARVAWLVLAMTMATLPFLSALPPWQTLAIIVLGTWRLVLEHRGLVVVPGLPVRLVLVLIVAGLLFATGNLGFGLTAATPLFIALLWSKLLELKARRDYLIACVLSYFLVAVLLFDRQSLFTCLYAIATLGAITVALVSYHLDHGARRSFTLGTRLLLQGLPLAAALFVLFPRIQVNFPNLTGQATSGFTDKLTPGDVARLALSEEPVMRVEFPNQDMPDASQLYWRGLILSETDGKTWWAVQRPLAFDTLPEPSRPELPAVIQDITLQPLNQKWLFALDVAERPPELTRLALNRSLVRKYVPTQVLRYRVTSRIGDLPNDNEGTGRPLPTELDPRLRALAMEWRRGITDHRVIAERGLAWFKANGFTYSLSPGAMDAGSAEFLFDKRAGFCSHYATAYALVLRIAGVPARVVVGFRGGEPNPFGGFLTVRFNHAHAWVEVRQPDGWHRVDPTDGIPLAPGETETAAQRTASGNVLSEPDRSPWWVPGWLRGPYVRVNQWLAVVDAKWEANVMGVDENRQQEWLTSLGLQRFGNWLLLGLMAVVLVVVVVGFVWWSRIRPARPKREPASELWAQACQQLAALGVARLVHEGPRDFTERAAAALPEAQQAIQHLGAVYLALRYGRVTDQAADLARLRAAVRALPRRRVTRPVAPASASAASS
jgi:protein-glutamine gamma-glutamyltransferase